MAKNSSDKVMILKIKKYISHLGKVYDYIKNLSEDELEDELYAYSAAQLITNLKESYDMLQYDISQERYKLLRQPGIVRIRNISSHDYEALNWGVVKSGCRRIVEEYNSELYHEESIQFIDEIGLSEIGIELQEKLKEANNFKDGSDSSIPIEKHKSDILKPSSSFSQTK